MSEIFSFSGRIGRLSYFLSLIGIGVGVGVAAGVIVLLSVMLHSVLIGAVCFIPLVIAGSWVGLALQARRFRDIGWEPILVIPAWFVMQIVDSLAAKVYPDFSIRGQGHSTVVGFALSITLSLVLFFMPGADDEPTGVLPRRIV